MKKLQFANLIILWVLMLALFIILGAWLAGGSAPLMGYAPLIIILAFLLVYFVMAIKFYRNDFMENRLTKSACLFNILAVIILLAMVLFSNPITSEPLAGIFVGIVELFGFVLVIVISFIQFKIGYTIAKNSQSSK